MHLGFTATSVRAEVEGKLAGLLGNSGLAEHAMCTPVGWLGFCDSFNRSLRVQSKTVGYTNNMQMGYVDTHNFRVNGQVETPWL